jgi:hypothetical protein
MQAQREPALSLLTLSFLILGQHVQVACCNATLASAVSANYAACAFDPQDGQPDLRYHIAASEAQAGVFVLKCSEQPPVVLTGIGSVLFHLEKDLTVALQRKRPDLLFLHAAVLERGGRAFLLAGDSGHGKSTTAWGLLHHGFRYMSDELAPIELYSGRVLAYPRALSLKRLPPPAYPLPREDTLNLGATLHVPVCALPAASASASEPCELAAVVFVRYEAGSSAPSLEPIGAAEASARMYVTALNALAHPAQGLDAVVRLAERVPCFSLRSADLRETCDLMSRTFAAPGCS